MKTLNIYAALLFSIFAINSSFAQTIVKNETIKVAGNCGMCKNKIEKAATAAGATTASWNAATDILTVSYNPSKSSTEKIQNGIALSGYDTQDFKASDKAYNSLHACCKYERDTDVMLLKHGQQSKMDCKNMACCKDNGCCDKNGKCDGIACKKMPECRNKVCCKS